MMYESSFISSFIIDPCHTVDGQNHVAAGIFERSLQSVLSSNSRPKDIPQAARFTTLATMSHHVALDVLRSLNVEPW